MQARLYRIRRPNWLHGRVLLPNLRHIPTDKRNCEIKKRGLHKVIGKSTGKENHLQRTPILQFKLKNSEKQSYYQQNKIM